MYAFLFSPIHTTFPTHLILRDTVVLIVLAEEFKLWNSSLCSFLQPPITSFRFGPNVFPSAPFTNTLSITFNVFIPLRFIPVCSLVSVPVESFTNAGRTSPSVRTSLGLWCQKAHTGSHEAESFFRIRQRMQFSARRGEFNSISTQIN
jgi:hypothetical protein